MEPAEQGVAGPDSPTAAGAGARLPRALTLLLGGAAAVIVIAGLRELSFLLGPVFLALVIVLLVHPLHNRMLRRKVPRTVALLLLLLAIYGVIIVLAAILAYSIARLASILPDYAASARGVLDSIVSWLSTLGIDRAQLRQITSVLDVNRLAGLLTTLLSSVFSFGANVILLLSLLLFLGIESTGIGSRFAPLLATRPRTGRALIDFATKTRRFLAVTSVFAVIVGVADTLLLLWLDVPLAPLWGLLAAVCNFIPYVGFIIGLIPPALLSLFEGDWRRIPGDRRLHHPELGAHLPDPAVLRRRRGGALHGHHPGVGHLLGLGARAPRRGAGGPAHPAGQGRAGRRRSTGGVGPRLRGLRRTPTPPPPPEAYMISINLVAVLLFIAEVLLALAVAVYLSVNRKPSSAIAWIMAVVFIPLLGILFFLLVGAGRLPKSRREAQRQVSDYIWSGPRAASTSCGATVRGGRTGCLRSPCSTGTSAHCR